MNIKTLLDLLKIISINLKNQTWLDLDLNNFIIKEIKDDNISIIITINWKELFQIDIKKDKN